MMEEDIIRSRKSLGELIADQLKQDIYNQKIEYGQRLIETDLAERFDVSRSSIREAFKILEQEELVVSKSRKGTFVSVFTDKDLDEMTELRLILEPVAFRNALANITDEHIHALEEIVDKMKVEVDKNNWNRLFNLDTEFHQYIVSLCGNSRIVKIYESLSVQIRVYLAHLNQYYSSPTSFYNEHQELLRAIIQRDSSMVEEKIKNHITYVEEKLLRRTSHE